MPGEPINPVDSRGTVNPTRHGHSQLLSGTASGRTSASGALTIGNALKELSEAEPSDVQKIAGAQQALLTGIYELALQQSKTSFRWAVIAATAGLVLIIVAIALILFFELHSGASVAGVVSAISGGVVEVIAGVNFALYARTSAQLASFLPRLDQTQRFLLANSICANLEPPARETTRAALVLVIATPEPTPTSNK